MYCLFLIFRYKIFKYNIDLNKFNNTFLSYYPNDIKSNNLIDNSVNRVIYCFWTGNNSLTLNREIGLNSLIKNSGVEVKLITPSSLSEFIKPGFPLHEGYDYLSLVHKSDYLRCYFMHHYGGGYSDIKTNNNSLINCFYNLEENENKWCIGYREISEWAVAKLPVDFKNLNLELKKRFILLMGNGGYIFKANTPFTNEWYRQLNIVMDSKLDLLKKNPGNILGDNVGYPFQWTEILGQIFHPICLKYSDKILYSNKLRPSFINYR